MSDRRWPPTPFDPDHAGRWTAAHNAAWRTYRAYLTENTGEREAVAGAVAAAIGTYLTEGETRG